MTKYTDIVDLPMVATVLVSLRSHSEYGGSSDVACLPGFAGTRYSNSDIDDAINEALDGGAR